MFNALASMFGPFLPLAHIFDQAQGSIELITLLQDFSNSFSASSCCFAFAAMLLSSIEAQLSPCAGCHGARTETMPPSAMLSPWERPRVPVIGSLANSPATWQNLGPFHALRLKSLMPRGIPANSNADCTTQQFNRSGWGRTHLPHTAPNTLTANVLSLEPQPFASFQPIANGGAGKDSQTLRTRRQPCSDQKASPLQSDETCHLSWESQRCAS